jgi:signal transduction histidine kinase
MTSHLSKDHTILEKGSMEFRPFGVDEQGRKIRDVTGVKVEAYVTYLEETVARLRGADAGKQAVETLCRVLNQRIPDPAYYVTPQFLQKVWNSYSYEFVCFMMEFCIILSEDPQFSYHAGKAKFISPLIQTLGRPFTMPQIYKMFPHFGQKFAKNSIEFGVGTVTQNSAVLRIRYMNHIYDQFGSYRQRCAEQICQASKAALSAVPEDIHQLGYATIKDLQCIANGDEWCEWEFTWTPAEHMPFGWSLWGILGGFGALGYLQIMHPSVTLLEALIIALIPPLGAWFGMRKRQEQDTKRREALIKEQLETLENRHEELREAYLEQEQATVELRRKVTQLTTFHNAGLLFSSTLDRETLIKNVLDTLTGELHFERAMLAFYDASRGIVFDSRLQGVPAEIVANIRSLQVPITDPDSIEGTILIRGEPLLINNIRESPAWDRLHKLSKLAVLKSELSSLLAVPLKAKDVIVGCLIVDRLPGHSLTQEDLEVMGTFASHVAIALDNTRAYHQIEELNAGLELRVKERTAEIEAANEELQELDRLKSQFLAHVSHELRSPLTSIKGFAENMLEGMAGNTTEKQVQYLRRIQANSGRLARMISDLLDRSKMEAGKMELSLGNVPVIELTREVTEQFKPLAQIKGQHLTFEYSPPDLMVHADGDKVNQVLTNLIENALKYTPTDGSIRVQIEPQDPNLVLISVIDTGQGIPADALPYIFTPFFRVKRPSLQHIEGLGLGLSISKQLVEMQGGTLSVESTEGKGTTFSFTLPRSQATPPIPTVDLFQEKRILVVDDDSDIRQLLVDRLQGEGFQIEAATNGHEALEALKVHTFDGVILDIGLPDMDGLEILQDFRKTHPDVPVIMITATEAEERAQTAMKHGATAYLLKPFDPVQFRYVTGQCFGRKEKVTTH